MTILIIYPVLLLLSNEIRSTQLHNQKGNIMKKLLILALLSDVAVGCSHCKPSHTVTYNRHHARHTPECTMRKEAMKNNNKLSTNPVNNGTTQDSTYVQSHPSTKHTVIVETTQPVKVTEYEEAVIVTDKHSTVEGRLGEVINDVKKTATAATEKVSAKVTQVRQDATHKAEEVVNKVKDTKEKVVEGAKERGEKLKEAGKVLKETAYEVGHDLAKAGKTAVEGTKEAAKAAVK